MMEVSPYKRLAERLDALPNGFPPTEDGVELQLLEKIFTPEEAALTAELRITQETPERIAGRIDGDTEVLSKQLKGMARKGLITAGRTEEGLVYGLMPFVIGIYEMQVGNLDAEFARLFEEYYMKVFGQALGVKPSYIGSNMLLAAVLSLTKYGLSSRPRKISGIRDRYSPL